MSAHEWFNLHLLPLCYFHGSGYFEKIQLLAIIASLMDGPTIHMVLELVINLCVVGFISGWMVWIARQGVRVTTLHNRTNTSSFAYVC